ncbi:VOC family protein [Marinomonas transparens]|uniref:VOC family protein n=1 Tax=Marinomonas transparens TaxID=2795388 RepID=A0A934JU53_9GAMM|nr:VOC family protein [Marinomonas transparens]MBJ7537410.1 VOC family protein [Marinomonas transparens]
MISHLDHIVLTVADIEKAVSFYETTLKMEAISFGEGRRAVRFGNQKINFQLLGDEVRNHAMEGSGDLCLIAEWPMEKVMASLQESGINLLEGPVTKSGAQGPIESVYFNDLDNNLIEVSVYQEGELSHTDTHHTDEQSDNATVEESSSSTGAKSSSQPSSSTKYE